MIVHPTEVRGQAVSRTSYLWFVASIKTDIDHISVFFYCRFPYIPRWLTSLVLWSIAGSQFPGMSSASSSTLQTLTLSKRLI
jgi:hypothetical protein